MTQTQRITPTISGEFITHHARNLVLKGHWQDALKLLVNDLEGMSYDLAFDILKGHRHITDGPDGMGVSQDDTESGEEYRESLDQTYGHLAHIQGRFYQPAMVIRNFGAMDAQYAEENGHGRDDRAARAGLYSTWDQRVVELTIKDKAFPVIFDPVQGVPLWINGEYSAQQALDHHISQGFHLADPSQGMDTTMIASVDTLGLSIEPEELGQAVRDKAQELGGFMTMEVTDETNRPLKTLSVPRNAFYQWALNKTPAQALGLMPEWTPMAPAGYKMGSDSRVHSDWWFGAGLTLEDYRLADDLDTRGWKHALDRAIALKEREVQRELLGFEAVFLGAIKGCQGKVRHLKPGEEINKGEVGVISHAGPEFEITMRSAIRNRTGLICLAGGRLAHLAVVARESDAILVMWPEADKLQNGMAVEIDPETRQVRV